MLIFIKKIWNYILDIISHNEIRDTYSTEYKHGCNNSNDKQKP